jgi:Asp-tRNA(Asn)/Glu-tRNA(Gln) amidotransferase A subunit family amidase
VAVYEDDFLQPVARDCRRAVRVAADALADAGHEVVDERPPRQEEFRDAFDTIVRAEFAGGLADVAAGREPELSDYGRMAVESAGAEVPLPACRLPSRAAAG